METIPLGSYKVLADTVRSEADHNSRNKYDGRCVLKTGFRMIYVTRRGLEAGKPAIVVEVYAHIFQKKRFDIPVYMKYEYSEAANEPILIDYIYKEDYDAAFMAARNWVMTKLHVEACRKARLYA